MPFFFKLYLPCWRLGGNKGCARHVLGKKMMKVSTFGWIQNYSIILTKAIRIVLLLLIGVLPFAGCDKSKDDNDTKPTQQPQNGYTITYTYNSGFNVCRGSATWDYNTLINRTDFIDTLRLHGNNPNVNKVKLEPDDPNLFGTSAESSMVTRANALEDILNASNNKATGEGTTLYLQRAALNNPRVQGVFHGKLKATLLEATY